MKQNTSFEAWRAIGTAAGCNKSFLPSDGGIYQVRALSFLTNSAYTNESFYVWRPGEDPATGIKKDGNIKSFGVADQQWQIDICDLARGFIGSTQYLEMVEMPAQYGFSSYPGRFMSYKCNIFVAHRAAQAGITVPAIHGRLFRNYPPLANEWGDSSFTIAGWLCVSPEELPQPGYISAHPSGDDTSGHVGIVDFDGMGISAGMLNVNRNYFAVGVGNVLRKFTGGDQ